MTAKPENPPATDTAKAIELLRQQVESGLWVGRATQADLVECFAAAVEASIARSAFNASVTGATSSAYTKASKQLDAAIAKVTKGVLGDG